MNLDNFGMDTITLAGALEGKLRAIRAAADEHEALAIDDAKPGAGALAVLALIAAFALVTGISELVVAIGGAKLLEWKARKALAPPATSRKTTPQPSH